MTGSSSRWFQLKEMSVKKQNKNEVKKYGILIICNFILIIWSILGTCTGWSQH